MTATKYRAVAGFLSLWLAFAPAFFAAPATAMTAHMGMSDRGEAGGCDNCPKKAPDRGACMSVCVDLLSVGLEPSHAKSIYAPMAVEHALRPYPALKGEIPPPDPDPPRTTFH